MNRDLALATIVVMLLAAAGIVTWVKTPEATRIAFQDFETMEIETPVGRELMAIAKDAAISSTDESREFSNWNIEITKVCQGVVERYQSAKNSVHIDQQPLTLIFLSGPQDEIARAKVSYENNGKMITASLISLNDLRLSEKTLQQGDYQELLEDAIEVCVGVDKSPRQISLEASNLKDDITRYATAVIRIPRADLNSQSKLSLFRKHEGEVQTLEFNLEDLLHQVWVSPNTYSYQERDRRGG